jgi:predicted lipoprotein with Yx(FWY)xxD motif
VRRAPTSGGRNTLSEAILVNRHTRGFIAATGSALLLSATTVAYAQGDSHSSASGAHAAASAVSTSSSATVSTKSTPLGKILVNGKGHTLYLFQSDQKNKSTCNGDCAKAWPPLKANGKTIAKGGVNSKLLSAITRSDGSKQVTYNGHPLYTFADDTKAGQTNGQGIDAFGAKWYVLGTDGKQITKQSSSQSGGY